MKVKIIYPTRLNKQGRPLITKAKEAKFLNLSFVYLAGLTPHYNDIDVVDEIFEEINFDEPVDLVALTAMTNQAPRAYQIADEYRKRGVMTVMGGFHASFMTEEALKHVDSVVIGEAEPVWADVLKDAEKKELKKTYQGKILESLAGLPAPRYDLIKNKRQRYSYYTMWAGRGCHQNCNYCSVIKFYGRGVRTRPVDDIMRDVSMLPQKRAIFVDDNLFACREMIEELLVRLAPSKLRWAGQVDPAYAEDEKLLDLAQAAGMGGVYIGLESFVQKEFDRFNRGWMGLERYKKLIKGFQDRGVLVCASLIFGMGKESADTVKYMLDQLEAMHVSELAVYMLTPLPGTKLWEELHEKGVEFSKNWSLYDGNSALLVPDGMDNDELEKLYWSLYQGFYRPSSTMKRFFRFPHRLREWIPSLARNLLVYRNDVNSHRSIFDNFFTFKDFIPGYYPFKY